MLISILGPMLSPGTARACSLGRRAVPGGVTVPNSNQINYSKIKMNTINTILNQRTEQLELLTIEQFILTIHLDTDIIFSYLIVVPFTIFSFGTC